MGFGGHALDMILRTKLHRETSKYRKEKIAKVRDMYVNAVRVHTKTMFKEKNISSEELAEIKNEIRKTIRKERRQEIIMVCLIIIVSLAAVGYVFSCLII